jgi:hypothetical protein
MNREMKPMKVLGYLNKNLKFGMIIKLKEGSLNWEIKYYCSTLALSFLQVS